jgi:hypothetical protein
MCGSLHLQLELLLEEKQQVLQTQDAIQNELRERVASQSDLERQLGEQMLVFGAGAKLQAWPVHESLAALLVFIALLIDLVQHTVC